MASITFAANLPDAGRLLKESAPPPATFHQQMPPDLPQQSKTVEQKGDPTKIRVSYFVFTGNTIFSCCELSALMAAYKGKEMTLAELEIAASAITHAYKKRGYFLASVLFPPQTVTQGGILIIEVREGILENIYVATTPATTKTQKSVLEYYASHLPLNQPLDDASLTSMVMRTNELPNISSRIMLEPGSRAGTTKATLQVTEGKPYSFSLNMDNYGNLTTGEDHFSGTMDLYSPLHLGDQFSLRMQTSTIGNLQNIQAGYTIPLISYGTKIGLTYNYLGYQMGGAFTSLHANGTAKNLSISLSHAMVRRKELLLNATVAAEGSILDDRVESAGSKNLRLNGSIQVGISGIGTDITHGGGAGSTLFSFGLVTGRLNIRDDETLVIDQSATGLHTNGHYTKWNMSLVRSQTLYQGLSLSTGAYGQWSNNNLGSSEQLSLTGASAVRAFQTNEASADRAIVSTIELRYLFPSTGELPGNLEVSAFVDHGYATLHTNPIAEAESNSLNLTGAGFGISWFENSNFSIKSTAAWKIAGESTSPKGAVVYAKVTKYF
ncbi:MAG: ShlB/FhaC/HecB family hemolysin secretion/activation protein [Chlorobium sp.]